MVVFVSDLPESMTDSALRDLVAPFADVLSARIIVDREAGLSLRFGFVAVSCRAMALAAAHALDGLEIEGQYISARFVHYSGTAGALPIRERFSPFVRRRSA